MEKPLSSVSKGPLLEPSIPPAGREALPEFPGPAGEQNHCSCLRNDKKLSPFLKE